MTDQTLAGLRPLNHCGEGSVVKVSLPNGNAPDRTLTVHTVVVGERIRGYYRYVSPIDDLEKNWGIPMDTLVEVVTRIEDGYR